MIAHLCQTTPPPIIHHQCFHEMFLARGIASLDPTHKAARAQPEILGVEANRPIAHHDEWKGGLRVRIERQLAGDEDVAGVEEPQRLASDLLSVVSHTVARQNLTLSL